MDRSGRLGYDEFKKLWNDLRLWKVGSLMDTRWGGGGGGTGCVSGNHYVVFMYT